MFKKLLPDIILNNIFEINEQFLENHSIKLLLLDIDNTLVPHGKESTLEIEKWISDLKEKGYEFCIISNNRKPRVDMFNKNINIPAFHNTKKPNKTIYYRVLQQFKVDKKNAAAVGDQLFTDIWGGNRSGLLTIFVKPIDIHEPLQIRGKRVLEKAIFKLNSRNIKRKDSHDN